MLDARQFYFRSLNTPTSSVFDLFVRPSNEDRPQIQSRVRFNNLEDLDREENGCRFGYYGEGTVDAYEAVKLTDGTYLFCLVRGRQFTDTFSPEEQVQMKYYKVTPITNQHDR